MITWLTYRYRYIHFFQLNNDLLTRPPLVIIITIYSFVEYLLHYFPHLPIAWNLSQSPKINDLHSKYMNIHIFLFYFFPIPIIITYVGFIVYREGECRRCYVSPPAILSVGCCPRRNKSCLRNIDCRLCYVSAILSVVYSPFTSCIRKWL